MEKKRVIITSLFNQPDQGICFSAEINILQTTKGLNRKRQLTKVLDLKAAYIIYHNTCNFGSTCIGRTDRHLHQRIGAHVPKWLVDYVIHTSPEQKVSTKKMASSVAEQLTTFRHNTDPNHGFHLIL